jgi:hypothetical protein
MNIYRKNYRRYDMEEVFFTPETKLAMTLRVNSEIVAALASVELMEENIEIITTLLHKHSSFVLEVSHKSSTSRTPRCEDS